MESIVSTILPTVISHIIITYVSRPTYEFKKNNIYGIQFSGIITSIINHKIYTFDKNTKCLTIQKLENGFRYGYNSNCIFVYKKNIYVLYSNVIYVFDKQLHATHFIHFNFVCNEFVIHDEKIFLVGIRTNKLYVSNLSGKIIQIITIPHPIRSPKVINNTLYLLLWNNTISQCYDEGRASISISFDGEQKNSQENLQEDLQRNIPEKEIIEKKNDVKSGPILDFCIIDTELHIFTQSGVICIVDEYDWTLARTNMNVLDHKYTFVCGIDNISDILYLRSSAHTDTTYKISILNITKRYYI